MAKKKSSPKMPAAVEPKTINHARIELPTPDYERLRACANRYHISVSAYIRQAVMERIERDESRGAKP